MIVESVSLDIKIKLGMDTASVAAGGQFDNYRYSSSNKD